MSNRHPWLTKHVADDSPLTWGGYLTMLGLECIAGGLVGWGLRDHENWLSFIIGLYVMWSWLSLSNHEGW